MILKMEKQDSNIDVTETALSLKERGNQCIKEENFKEAALLYTHAIKLEPDNFSLYSNRSLAYLKSKHYYLSLQDANETIRLQPQWAKGYFRRAEVEAAVGLTDEATLSYTRALQLQPQDSNIIEAINRVTLARKRKKEADDKLPWLCCCVGVTIGVTLVILDHVFGKHENPVNPLMQVSFVLTVAGAALGLGKGFNMYVDSNISSPLLVPPDTEDEAVRKLPSVYRWASLAMALVLVLIDCSLEIIDLKTPGARVLFVIVCTLAGWAVGHLVRRSKIQNSNIQTDKSTEEEPPAEENVVPEKITNKYTKAQARYRYKKGKKN